MEKKFLIPALTLSLLSFTAFAAGTSSDSTADVNKFTMPSFADMDSNHDGMMSSEEYSAAMDKMHASSMSGDSMSGDSMSHDSMKGDAMAPDASITHSTPGKDAITPPPGDAIGK